jgi:hypothetical protein
VGKSEAIRGVIFLGLKFIISLINLALGPHHYGPQLAVHFRACHLRARPQYNRPPFELQTFHMIDHLQIIFRSMSKIDINSPPTSAPSHSVLILLNT